MASAVSTKSITETSIEITIVRADGSIEPQGVVSYWHRNPLKRWAWFVKKLLGFHK